MAKLGYNAVSGILISHTYFFQIRSYKLKKNPDYQHIFKVPNSPLPPTLPHKISIKVCSSFHRPPIPVSFTQSTWSPSDTTDPVMYVASITPTYPSPSLVSKWGNCTFSISTFKRYCCTGVVLFLQYRNSSYSLTWKWWLPCMALSYCMQQTATTLNNRIMHKYFIASHYSTFHCPRLKQTFHSCLLSHSFQLLAIHQLTFWMTTSNGFLCLMFPTLLKEESQQSSS